MDVPMQRCSLALGKYRAIDETGRRAQHLCCQEFWTLAAEKSLGRECLYRPYQNRHRWARREA